MFFQERFFYEGHSDLTMFLTVKVTILVKDNPIVGKPPKVNCRSISSGICQIIGRCGTLTLPYFPLLAQQYQLAVLFLLPAIAGSIYFLLPTVPREDGYGNRIIYEKVSETNALLKEKSIFKKKDSREEIA